MTFNSAGKGGADVDSFEVTKDLSGPNKMAMTAIVVAPDLGSYEDYGRNYALAGDGKVSMSKLTIFSLFYILTQVATLVDKKEARP